MNHDGNSQYTYTQLNPQTTTIHKIYPQVKHLLEYITHGKHLRNTTCCYLFIYLFIYVFLGLHLWHMEVLRVGVELELQLLAHATATAKQDLSRICNLYHRSQQCCILNALSKARDQTHVLMQTSRVRYCWAMMGTPIIIYEPTTHTKIICLCTHCYSYKSTHTKYISDYANACNHTCNFVCLQIMLYFTYAQLHPQLPPHTAHFRCN